MALVVRQLRETDDRGDFRSGDEDLDRFFHRFAGQDQFRHHIGTTYVAVDGGVIVGYATVASCSIEVKDLPARAAKKLPSYPLPALRLVRMAVSATRQRGGVGSRLLKAVFLIALEQRDRTGCAFIIVDAKAKAVAFHARFGFEPKPVIAGELDARPAPLTMFLPIGAIPRSAEAPPQS
jgi:GNAT superfamily N-acetyltransferase